jgi:ArsR family transcriptional regulator, arsenate/arsenite/antimonite-responsive transcriptional repressor
LHALFSVFIADFDSQVALCRANRKLQLARSNALDKLKLPSYISIMVELLNKLPAQISEKISEDATVKALLALAQTHRLRVFRALVMAGVSGLTPSTLTASLGVAPTSLSFHLKELLNAGLISREAHGRNLIYRAEFTQMTALLGYLTEHCCAAASSAESCDLPDGGNSSCKAC